MNQKTPITLDELLLNLGNKFQVNAPQIQAALHGAQDALTRFLAQNPDIYEHIYHFIKELQTLPEWQRETLITAAKRGWYINPQTPASMRSAILAGEKALDCYMVEHLEEDWSVIITSILSSHPHRHEILKCAFQLHTEGHYIASIPLMLAQVDGICAQALSAHFFTDHEARGYKLSEISESTDSYLSILLELLGLRTQLSAGISKYTASKKALAPNRNGILHGSHRHLDYGTKINSLKTLSLLAFITFVLKEVRINKSHS